MPDVRLHNQTSVWRTGLRESPTESTLTESNIPPTLGSLSVWVGGCDVVIIFIGKQSTSVVNKVSFTGMIHTLFMSL